MVPVGYRLGTPVRLLVSLPPSPSHPPYSSAGVGGDGVWPVRAGGRACGHLLIGSGLSLVVVVVAVPSRCLSVCLLLLLRGIRYICSGVNRFVAYLRADRFPDLLWGWDCYGKGCTAAGLELYDRNEKLRQYKITPVPS